jgi:hypothetical protein
MFGEESNILDDSIVLWSLPRVGELVFDFGQIRTHWGKAVVLTHQTDQPSHCFPTHQNYPVFNATATLVFKTHATNVVILSLAAFVDFESVVKVFTLTCKDVVDGDYWLEGMEGPSQLVHLVGGLGTHHNVELRDRFA